MSLLLVPFSKQKDLIYTVYNHCKTLNMWYNLFDFVTKPYCL